MTAPIRVVVVDDHPVVRDGTAALLAAQDGIEVAGTAGSIDEARQVLATVAADVVLLDIRLGTETRPLPAHGRRGRGRRSSW